MNKPAKVAKILSSVFLVISFIYDACPNLPLPFDDITLTLTAVLNAINVLLDPKSAIIKKVTDILRKVFLIIYIAIMVIGGLIFLLTLYLVGVDVKYAIWIYLIILAAVILTVRRFQSKIIGTIGEKYTAYRIHLITGGHVLTDIYAESSDNVVQIDLIAVTSKGILVIEKKTMIGLILGDEYQRVWTVCLHRGKEKHKLKNPLHQNFGHIKVLEELFPQYSAYYKNVVIFGDNAKLGDKLPKNVINDRDFFKYYNVLPGIMDKSQQATFTELILGLGKDRKRLKRRHRMKIKGR